jgi:hypothetical protein
VNNISTALLQEICNELDIRSRITRSDRLEVVVPSTSGSVGRHTHHQDVVVITFHRLQKQDEWLVTVHTALSVLLAHKILDTALVRHGFFPAHVALSSRTGLCDSDR